MLSALKQGFQKVLDYLVATPAGHGVLVPYPHVQPMFTSTPSGLGEGFNLAVQVRKEVARFTRDYESKMNEKLKEIEADNERMKQEIVGLKEALKSKSNEGANVGRGGGASSSGGQVNLRISELPSTSWCRCKKKKLDLFTSLERPSW